ncbi:lysophospholipid acyltransferase family protein [Kineococcus radiotolerans]|uniref:Phospholipid/glycerol acyltransferase n=1 Tax=Kineococcus radiotolerans (strain ATCC BAA-149 / DSM 14245 / SRS30216) TaxID=266940 RepID=A6WD10_KINRD|nr:lysophospholipid acyltransferase family protein [Kineococcus radiotolerans]ABS04699.1 phospholipid/glycerol acyltransferase [Kineococcus radiotolerans SRS30216 = ATCC BAA-149]
MPGFPVLYWPIKLLVAEPLVTAVFRPWVRGLEHVPSSGPAILASNHLSAADTVLLPTVVQRRVTFIAKADLFTGRGLRGKLTKGLMHGIGQLPVDRSGGRASTAAIDSAVRVLGEGELLGIYPEGTRSPDGRLYRGRTGVARIALASGAPVVPVAMIGTEDLLPTGRKLPRVRRVGAVFGPPLDFSRYAGRGDDQLVARSITDEVMYAIQKLSRQEYVDAYAERSRLRTELSRSTGVPEPPTTSSGGPGGRAAPPGEAPGPDAPRDGDAHR